MSKVSSVTGVTVSNEEQEKIRRQMEANSLAWHSADEATKKQLEESNKALARQMGGLSFDSTTGTWSGAAAHERPTAWTGDVEDYSRYIQQLSDARRTKTMAELEKAYKNSLSDIAMAGAVVEDQAQADKNRAAGESEAAARAFYEYAAARGLGSGTAGQAQLARSMALQQGMNAITAEKNAALGQLEAQRARVENDHRTGVVQAQAEEDAALARSLYEEKVRMQKLLLEQAEKEEQREWEREQAEKAWANADREYAYKAALSDRSYAYQLARDQVEDSQWNSSQALKELQAKADIADNEYQTGLDVAEYAFQMLRIGIMPPDNMLKAMGISEDQAREYIKAYGWS